MSCYLCNSGKYSKRPGSIRDDSSIEILECNDCGLVYLSSINHIRENHYEDSGMHGGDEPDIDKWLKETQFDDERRYNFVKEKIARKTILDFGCGAGGFINRAQKSANKVSGVELERSLQQSFNKRNLNVFPDLLVAEKEGYKYDFITAFHVVEHLSDPKKILWQNRLTGATLILVGLVMGTS